jgi:hypothetical protein
MDIQFIREVINEQVRLNVAICELTHINTDLVHERDQLRKECEEWKEKYEEYRKQHENGVNMLYDELKKVRKDVEVNGVIPFDIMNSDTEESDEEENEEEEKEEEKNIVIVEDDKKKKRQEYMRDYMRKQRKSKKADVNE